MSRTGKSTYVYNDTLKVHIGQTKNELTSFDKPTQPYVTANNKDLKLQIVSSPGQASRSGWYSTWRCVVTTPENLVFYAEIDSKILCSLLANNTVVNGVVKEPVEYASINGMPAFINSNMPEYESCMAYTRYKLQYKKAKKTTKWEPGCVYETALKRAIYLGDVYVWVDEDNPNDMTYKLLKEPIKKKLVFDMTFNTKAESVADILKDARWSRFSLLDKLPARTLSTKPWDSEFSTSDVVAWQKREMENIKRINEFSYYSFDMNSFTFDNTLPKEQLEHLKLFERPARGAVKLLKS
jgi:hypothetical protein